MHKSLPHVAPGEPHPGLGAALKTRSSGQGQATPARSSTSPSCPAGWPA